MWVVGNTIEEAALQGGDVDVMNGFKVSKCVKDQYVIGPGTHPMTHCGVKDVEQVAVPSETFTATRKPTVG